MNRRERLSVFLHDRASGLVHRADWLYVALSLLSGASWFLPSANWTVLLSLLLSLLACAGIFIARQHGAKLCEHCVADFSINAPEHAAQHTRRFWLFHHSSWGLAVAGPLVGATLFIPRPWSGFAYLPLSGAMALTTLLIRFHSSYQPWCPYCGDDDGGGDTEEAPTPTGGHGRPLPVV